MAGERRAVENPMRVDLAQSLAPPLGFVLQHDHRPAGLVDELAPGVIRSQTPWHAEFTLTLTGIDAVAVLYLLPVDEHNDLLMACIDTALDPLFGFLTGADFGDPMTTLVATQWPDVYGMLLHGARSTPRRRVLARVQTVTAVQWVVADQIPASAGGFDAEQAMDLVVGALDVFVRVSRFPTELPGVLEVLGGPDRTTRRLKGLAGLFNSAADFGTSSVDLYESLGGALDGKALADMVKAAREFLSSVREVKD